MSLPIESTTTKNCNCCDCNNQNTQRKVTKKTASDIHTQARQLQTPQPVVVQQQPCGSTLGSGIGGFIGGIFGAIGGAISGLGNSAAQLVGAMNSGGMNIGQLYLMNKMMKNNNHCCGSHYSSPLIVNTYRSYPLVRSFGKPMPSSFCWRPNNIAFDGPGLFKSSHQFKPFGRNIC